MSKPCIAWDEGDMVVIDLLGRGEWLDPKIEKPAATWWLERGQAEALLVALVEFLMTEPPSEEDLF